MKKINIYISLGKNSMSKKERERERDRERTEERKASRQAKKEGEKIKYSNLRRKRPHGTMCHIPKPRIYFSKLNNLI